MDHLEISKQKSHFLELKQSAYEKTFVYNKTFFVGFIYLALPIALQHLINSTVALIDVIMIGKLGETQIAAVGISAHIYFVLVMLFFGINNGMSIFMSQFWGDKDIDNIRKTLGLCLVLNICIASIFFIFAHFFAECMMSLFSDDKSVIEVGAQFLTIFSFSYIMSAIIHSYSTALRCIGQVSLATIASIITILLNCILNYILIFGKFGFPSLGIRGSALSTLIAISLELIIILSGIYSKKYIICADIRELLSFSAGFSKLVIFKTIPVLLSESIWIFGTTMYTLIYSRLGTGYIVSYNVVRTIEDILVVWGIGIATACGVIVGNLIGAKREYEAYVYAKKYVILAVTSGIATGIILFFNIDLILSFFTISDEVRSGISKMLILSSFITIPMFFNIIAYTGIFKAGADINFIVVVNGLAAWGIAIPAAIIGGFIFKLPAEQVYFLVILEEIINFLIGLYRFLSKKWINNVIQDMEA